MSQRRNKPNKTFQQRQTEYRQREEQQLETIIEDMASKYTCSFETARDFAGQCKSRLHDLNFDLACSKVVLDFWSSVPERATPVVDILQELAAEHQRHAAVLRDLHEHLIELTKDDVVHQHLDLPIEHYKHELRLRLFPDRAPPPVQN